MLPVAGDDGDEVIDRRAHEEFADERPVLDDDGVELRQWQKPVCERIVQDIVVHDIVCLVILGGVVMAQAEGEPVVGGADRPGVVGYAVGVAAVGGDNDVATEGSPG
mgnify:CR=1 FL=1